MPQTLDEILQRIPLLDREKLLATPEPDTEARIDALMRERLADQSGAYPDEVERMVGSRALPGQEPWAPGVKAKRSLEEVLQEYVADPAERAGVGELGAAAAALPMAAADLVIPETVGDVTMGMAVGPKAPKGGKVVDLAKRRAELERAARESNPLGAAEMARAAARENTEEMSQYLRDEFNPPRALEVENPVDSFGNYRRQERAKSASNAPKPSENLMAKEIEARLTPEQNRTLADIGAMLDSGSMGDWKEAAGELKNAGIDQDVAEKILGWFGTKPDHLKRLSGDYAAMAETMSDKALRKAASDFERYLSSVETMGPKTVDRQQQISAHAADIKGQLEAVYRELSRRGK